MKQSFVNISRNLAICFALATVVTGCQPDEVDGGNPLENPNADASFSVTAIDGSPNRFRLQGNTDNIINHFWNNGTGNARGGSSLDIFLPDAGTYTISHTACGAGGVCNTATQTITVDTPDPVAGNLIRGGSFETAEDIAQWTVLPMSPDASWTFAGGQATLTSGPTGWAQEGLYQAIQVEAGHEYRFDMKVSGPGWTDSVFELYADYQVPVPNSGDYSAGGKVLSLNTWGGCGNAPFEGQLFNLSCDSQHHGLKTFPTSGTVYVLVRGGGAPGNFNITIDNVEVRRND